MQGSRIAIETGGESSASPIRRCQSAQRNSQKNSSPEILSNLTPRSSRSTMTPRRRVLSIENSSQFILSADEIGSRRSLYSLQSLRSMKSLQSIENFVITTSVPNTRENMFGISYEQNNSSCKSLSRSTRGNDQNNSSCKSLSRSTRGNDQNNSSSKSVSRTIHDDTDMGASGNRPQFTPHTSSKSNRSSTKSNKLTSPRFSTKNIINALETIESLQQSVMMDDCDEQIIPTNVSTKPISQVPLPQPESHQNQCVPSNHCIIA